MENNSEWSDQGAAGVADNVMKFFRDPDPEPKEAPPTENPVVNDERR